MTNPILSSQSSAACATSAATSNATQYQIASALGLSSSTAVSSTAVALFSQTQAVAQRTLTDRVTHMLATTSLEEAPQIQSWGSKPLDLPPELLNIIVNYLSPEELDNYIKEFINNIPVSTPKDSIISLIDLFVQHNKAYRTERFLMLQKKREDLLKAPIWFQSVIFFCANGTSTAEKPFPVLCPIHTKPKMITDLSSFCNSCSRILSENVKKRLLSFSDQTARINYLKIDFHTEETSIPARIAAAHYFKDTKRLEGYFKQHTPQARLELIDAMTSYFGTEAEEYLINCAFSIAPMLFQPIIPAASQEQLDSLEKNLFSIYSTFFSERTEETDTQLHSVISRILQSDSKDLRNCATHLVYSLQKAISASESQTTSSNASNANPLRAHITFAIQQCLELHKKCSTNFTQDFLDMYFRYIPYEQPRLRLDISRFLRDGLELKMASTSAQALYTLAAYELVEGIRLISKIDTIKEKILTHFPEFIISKEDAKALLSKDIRTLFRDESILQQDCERLEYRQYLTTRSASLSTNQILKLFITFGFLQ